MDGEDTTREGRGPPELALKVGKIQRFTEDRGLFWNWGNGRSRPETSRHTRTQGNPASRLVGFSYCQENDRTLTSREYQLRGGKAWVSPQAQRETAKDFPERKRFESVWVRQRYASLHSRA